MLLEIGVELVRSVNTIPYSAGLAGPLNPGKKFG
jgi:hypothetical protein